MGQTINVSTPSIVTSQSKGLVFSSAKLGANAILGVSLAVAKAGAAHKAFEASFDAIQKADSLLISLGRSFVPPSSGFGWKS